MFLITDAELRDANATVRTELLEHGEYYNGFVGSVESAIIESNADSIHELAIDIVNRIAGES